MDYRRELEMILGNGRLDPQNAGYLTKPHIKPFRASVKPEDKGRILLLMESDDENTLRVGISPSKRIEEDPDVRASLLNMWKNKDSVTVRFEAMYRVLDSEDVEENTIGEIHEFVKQNWEQWKEHVIQWEGGTEAILGSIRQKHQGVYPPHKSWAYLYELLWVPESDRPAALEIARMHLGSESPLTRRVAEKVTGALEASETF